MKILFVTSNRVGDAILSTGILSHLVARPGARVTVACGPAAAALFADVPGVERVVVMTKRRRGGHWLDLWRQTVGSFWDLVVDLRGSALAWLVPCRRRRVFRPSHDPVHRVVQLARLLKLDPPPAPQLWVGVADDERAAVLMDGSGPVLAVGPTANWGGKVWPAERFAAAIAVLTAPTGILPGARVAVVGGPGERDMARPVLDSLPPERRIDLVGNQPLGVVGACLRRTALYVGNDSGLMHMAAAAGTPTLGLFGPSKEEHYAPWGERCATVRTRQSFHDIVHGEGYDFTSQATRMDGLSVEDVVAAATALWARCGT
ncbi:MAG: glycosyltransferase family 9 protein [Magnetospirillum sp.]|nr:glycosyltransferase family 9 protein [Magnetospirillum sp.]